MNDPQQPAAHAKVVRSLTGVVVNAAADKTVRVQIGRMRMHALYGKVIRSKSNVLAHDADNTYKVGDIVRIVESPRFSKRKSWVVEGLAKGER